MSSEPENPNREEQVVTLLRAAAQQGRAPESLRAEVTAMRERAAARPRRRPTFRRPVLGAVSLGMPAAAAAVVALLLTIGGAGAPSLAQAAALANLRPAAPAPGTDPRDPANLLTAKVGTLHFPNWEANGGWHAVGERTDHVGNRTATTVYYATGSRRVVYSIVSSPTISLKARGLTLESKPPQTYLIRHGRVTYVWEESGHTCLLTGSPGMTAPQLWQLASYRFRRALAQP